MFVFNGSDLSSRGYGTQERERLLGALSQGGKVTVDLSNVESMAESFSDEVFGVIVLTKGYNYLREHVAIKNANHSVKNSIAISIARRKNEERNNKNAL